MARFLEGIKIIGGCSLDGEEDYGIFVKRVLPGGLAEIEGNSLAIFTRFYQ